MTAVWLLPIVAAEVTAASGGLLIGHLPPGAAATRILFTSYMLWGTSVLPALGILVILFLRLVLHKLPKREMAVSSWLSLGPIGTGALGLLLLGEQASRLFAGTAMADLGLAAHGLGVIGATALWGLRIVVAGAGHSRDAALPERGTAVQHGLVGLHVPLGRVRRGPPSP